MVKKKSSASKKAVNNENIFKVLLSVDARITGIEEQIADLPTKTEVEKIVEEASKEARGEIRGISKDVKAMSTAVDKDAETIFKHERRITRIESYLSIK
mgnify:FL=1